LFKNIRAVLLDRDGVVNRDSEEWEVFPGVLEAIGKLRSAGLPVGICSNQSGIARGVVPMAQLAAINKRMHAAVRRGGGHIGLIRYCPHGPDEGCRCRKPAPGMILDAVRWLEISPANVLFIGDRQTDLLAARHAGCQIALVRTGHGSQTEHELGDPALVVFDDLLQTVEFVLRARVP
jgi:D-glycero-D-manno-heptose 1,7-bisphosphate phosphatase